MSLEIFFRVSKPTKVLSPYEEGNEAYYSGQSEDFCPYEDTDPKKESWMNGFRGKGVSSFIWGMAQRIK